jgi:hypothetical protein
VLVLCDDAELAEALAGRGLEASTLARYVPGDGQAGRHAAARGMRFAQEVLASCTGVAYRGVELAPALAHRLSEDMALFARVEAAVERAREEGRADLIFIARRPRESYARLVQVAIEAGTAPATALSLTIERGRLVPFRGRAGDIVLRRLAEGFTAASLDPGQPAAQDGAHRVKADGALAGREQGGLRSVRELSAQLLRGTGEDPRVEVLIVAAGATDLEADTRELSGAERATALTAALESLRGAGLACATVAETGHLARALRAADTPAPALEDVLRDPEELPDEELLRYEQPVRAIAERILEAQLAAPAALRRSQGADYYLRLCVLQAEMLGLLYARLQEIDSLDELLRSLRPRVMLCDPSGGWPSELARSSGVAVASDAAEARRRAGDGGSRRTRSEPALSG